MKAPKPTKIRKLTPADLDQAHGGVRIAPIDATPTGWECGGTYNCDTNATCTGTRCNYTIRS